MKVCSKMQNALPTLLVTANDKKLTACRLCDAMTKALDLVELTQSASP